MVNVFYSRLARVLLLLAVLGSLAFLPHHATKVYVADYKNVLGTSLEIKLAAEADQPAAAEAAALGEVDCLNKILSGYDPTSEFSRWLRAGPQAIRRPA